MRKITIASIVRGALVALVLPSSSASAQNVATWVSGTGSDTNNTCGDQLTPCREIYTALTNTTSGGTIQYPILHIDTQVNGSTLIINCTLIGELSDPIQ